MGGTAALLAVAGIAMGRWLWGKINAALESYTTAYAQEAAKIDARIGHLEELAEEQARLTKIVETIKDQIAAQAKSRDNRWAFWKDVYVGLIKDTTGWIRFYTNIKQMKPDVRVEMSSDAKVKALDEYRTLTDDFMTHLCLARLTLATEAITAVDKAATNLLMPTDPLLDTDLQKKINAYIDLRNLLCVAGRNQLWDTLETQTKSAAEDQI